MFLSFLIACSGPTTVDYSNGDATAGETVYATTCIACHGADGLGTSAGVDLTEPFTNDSDDEIADVIINGVGDMPAQGLDDTDVADVIAYVHSIL